MPLPNQSILWPGLQRTLVFKKEIERKQNTHPAISFKSSRVSGPWGSHSQHAAGLVSSAGRADGRSPGLRPPCASTWGNLGGTCCCQPLVKCKKDEVQTRLHISLAHSCAGLTACRPQLMQHGPGAKTWEKTFQGHHLLPASQQPLERDP